MLISAILFLPECFAPNYTLTTETELELVFHEQVPLVLLKVHWWTKHAYCKAWCGCLFRCYTTESQKKSIKQNIPRDLWEKVTAYSFINFYMRHHKCLLVTWLNLCFCQELIHEFLFIREYFLKRNHAKNKYHFNVAFFFLPPNKICF